VLEGAAEELELQVEEDEDQVELGAGVDEAESVQAVLESVQVEESSADELDESSADELDDGRTLQRLALAERLRLARASCPRKPLAW